MPLYEYQCLQHRHSFDVRHGINEAPVATCPECGSPVRRVIHPVGIVFRGSGFYVNDSRKSQSTTKPASTEGKSETKSESSTDTKSDKASSTKAAEPSSPRSDTSTT